MVLEIIAIVLSSLSVLFSLLTFFLHDRKLVKIEEARRKNEIEERERNSYLNRPQLKVVYSSFDIKTFGYKYEDDFDIDIFFLPYESLDVDESIYTPNKKKSKGNFIKEGKNNQHKSPICTYKDVFNKKDEWVNFVIHLKNVGKSKIKFYYLLCEAERSGSIIDANNDYEFQMLTMTKGAEYQCTGKRNFIEVNDIIKIKLNFHKDYILGNSFSAPFALYIEAEDGTHWCQGIFLDPNQTLESYSVSSEEFLNYFQGYYLDAVMYDRVYWAKKNKKKDIS